MDTENLKRLSIRKHQLNAIKAGEKLKAPYEGICPYEEMHCNVQLLFDAISDVIDALTDE
jgi:hypothetical protein